ncbi:hypothetical protein LR48_Vigan04g155300 [Vigna angularis]|uniref:Protein kinase domain-containing protein n=1 Tax=Phaseolus angularis TaxID=3914 RepID=A0A0L9UEJ9_PHAAN|nr:hypothetical protein LR48_Vigan04g155300 [Vigna angularis]
MSQYCIYEVIGLGGYSTIYRGQKKNTKNTDEYFAVKKVHKSQEPEVLEEFATD